MAASVFCYNKLVSDFFKTPVWELPHYCRFQIALKQDPSKVLFEIITNSCGCGRWEYNETTGQYRQVSGTCQYSIPRTVQGLRLALKRGRHDLLQEKSDPGIASDEDEQILEVLVG